MTYLGAAIGYGVIEGFGRLLVQREPLPTPIKKRGELLRFFELPPYDQG